MLVRLLIVSASCRDLHCRTYVSGVATPTLRRLFYKLRMRRRRRQVTKGNKMDDAPQLDEAGFARGIIENQKRLSNELRIICEKVSKNQPFYVCFIVV